MATRPRVEYEYMVAKDDSRTLTDEVIADAVPSEFATQEDLTPSIVADLLSDQRRRYALYYLEGCEYAATVDEVVEQIAVWETETQSRKLPDDIFERIHLEFRHVHLPKLVNFEIVDYDETSQLVALNDDADQLGEILHETARSESGRV